MFNCTNVSTRETEWRSQLKARKGTITFVSTAADENIDGGQGTDTVSYDGNFSQYVLTFRGNHNGHGQDDLKLTVSDTVGGRDGTDSLSGVEWLKFAEV